MNISGFLTSVNVQLSGFVYSIRTFVSIVGGWTRHEYDF